MKKNVFNGVFILSVGSILAKIFSAIYRICLTRILGGEGIGIYQLVFPLYSLCVVLATAGLPMAISKVISRNRGREKSVVKKCMTIISIISLTLTFLLIVLSKPLAILQGKAEISLCYVILAPTIILVSFASVLRGYFQGMENFTPSAVSNILEQFVKLAFGLILSVSLLRISLMASIVGAMVAIVVSEIVSVLVMLIYYKKQRPSSGEQVHISSKDLLKDILPITATNVIMPIATFIDSLLVVNLLSLNFTRDMSIFMYGLESGVVGSLVSLPTIFSFAIASVILPNISIKNSIFSRSNKLSVAIKVILIIAVPCVVCFTFVPDKLIELLYANRINGLGVEGLNIAHRLLTISGFGVVFLCISQVYSSSLQAVDERGVTVRNLAIGVMVKFILECVFMPSVKINIYALAVANTACYLTTMVLNHMEINEHFNLHINYMFAGKLIACNCAMILSLLAVLQIGTGFVHILLALFVAMVVYLVSLVLFRVFNKRDLAMVKYGVSKAS